MCSYHLHRRAQAKASHTHAQAKASDTHAQAKASAEPRRGGGAMRDDHGKIGLRALSSTAATLRRPQYYIATLVVAATTGGRCVIEKSRALVRRACLDHKLQRNQEKARWCGESGAVVELKDGLGKVVRPVAGFGEVGKWFPLAMIEEPARKALDCDDVLGFVQKWKRQDLAEQRGQGPRIHSNRHAKKLYDKDGFSALALPQASQKSVRIPAYRPAPPGGIWDMDL